MTRFICTLSMTPLVSVLTGFDCTVQRVYKCYSAINISFLLVLRNACMMPFFSPASPTAQLIGIIVAKETVINLSGSTRAAVPSEILALVMLSFESRGEITFLI